MFLSDGIQFSVDRLLLELVVDIFPLLLKGSDQLLTLLLWHKHLLTISIILFLDLHLAHEVVLILNLHLNLGHILWHLPVCLLLQEVPVLVGWQFWCSKDVLNSIGYDEVLV